MAAFYYIISTLVVIMPEQYRPRRKYCDCISIVPTLMLVHYKNAYSQMSDKKSERIKKNWIWNVVASLNGNIICRCSASQRSQWLCVNGQQVDNIFERVLCQIIAHSIDCMAAVLRVVNILSLFTHVFQWKDQTKSNKNLFSKLKIPNDLCFRPNRIGFFFQNSMYLLKLFEGEGSQAWNFETIPLAIIFSIKDCQFL